MAMRLMMSFGLVTMAMVMSLAMSLAISFIILSRCGWGSMNSQPWRLFCQQGGRRPHCTALNNATTVLL
jgi:hypothetical protein